MISNKFWCETYMMYPGTNFVYIAKKIEAYSRILSCHFHLFQNALIGLWTPSGKHFIWEINVILQKRWIYGFN